MRPMFLEFPGEASLATNGTQFMFGSNLLVAPKVIEFVGTYEIQLPGGNWYDFWTGLPIQGTSKMVDPPLDTLPVYVRAGSILPQQPLVQNVDETPQGPPRFRFTRGRIVRARSIRTTAIRWRTRAAISIACNSRVIRVPILYS